MERFLDGLCGVCGRKFRCVKRRVSKKMKGKFLVVFVLCIIFFMAL